MRIQRIRSSHEAEKKKVAVYCRVSTTQAEQEDSLEIQKTAYIQYIESQPEWELAGVYYDSKTGLNAEKREGFMEMIADACAGKIGLIICKSISRFSRNIIECQRYVDKLIQHNVTVIFEKEHLRTNDPTSRLIFSLMCAIAQAESRSISENVKVAYRHKVEEGVYTARKNQMLGYDTVDGKLVPGRDAWIVRFIFENYAEGVGISEICRALNLQGAGRQRTNKPFKHQIIAYMLTNESYIGDKRLQKQAPRNFITKEPDPTEPYVTNYLTNDHEAIVSREVWNKVQARLAREKEERKEKNIRRQGNSHELFGRVVCGCCQQYYIRRTYQKRKKNSGKMEKYHVWSCKGRTYGSECRNPNIKEEELMEKMKGLDRAIITREGDILSQADNM